MTFAELNVLARQLNDYCSGSVIHKIFSPDYPIDIIGSKILFCERVNNFIVFALKEGYLYLRPGLSRIRTAPVLNHSFCLCSIDLGPKGIIYAEGDERGFLVKQELSVPFCSVDIENLKERNLKRRTQGKYVFDFLDSLPGIDYMATDDILFNLKLSPFVMEYSEFDIIKNSIINHIQERESLGGSFYFTDLFGKRGNYIPKTRTQKCPSCNQAVSKIDIKRKVWYCEQCQKLS